MNIHKQWLKWVRSVSIAIPVDVLIFDVKGFSFIQTAKLAES